jgi:hypothetical protein
LSNNAVAGVAGINPSNRGGCLTGVEGCCRLARLGSLKREGRERRFIDP